VPVDSARTAASFSRFLFDTRLPARRAAAPAAGARVYSLRLNGTPNPLGTVAGRPLDRIRVHGLVCERFQRSRWYRLPRALAADVRTLTRTLARERLRIAPRSC
jgi:hypothetical protein